MPAIRLLIRSILLVLLIIIGILITIIFLRNKRQPNSLADTVAGNWLGAAAWLLGVRIKTSGKALPERTLFVANHISWLDILILGHLLPVHFLSKHEVKEMPVIGWLATRAGTLYIKRGNSNSLSGASSEITDALKQQHNCLVFAEGTTTDGHIKRFHSRIMQSAIDAEAMVQPVAIFFPVTNPETRRQRINPATLFLDDMPIGKSFRLIAREPHIDVEVHYLEPINSSGKRRDEIARHAYDEVVEAIKAIKKTRR